MSKSKGEELAEANISAMADLSSEDVFKSLYNNTKEEPAATEAKVDEQAEKDIAELEAEAPASTEAEPPVNTEKKEPASAETKEEVKEADKKEVVAEKDKEEVDGFEIPEEEKVADVSVKEEIESTWKDLAKTNFGVEIKEDTYEAYDAAVKETIAAEKARAKEEAMADVKKQFEETVAKAPESKLYLDFINNGGTHDEWMNPTREIQKLKALSDSELVAKDLELQGWSEENIEIELEEQVEKNRLKKNADALRLVLDTNEANIVKERADAQKIFVQQEQLRIEKAKEKDTNQIREAITKRNEFMDTPISEKHKDFVMKKYEKGEYHELFKDPNTIAEFLLYKEFGKQGVERLKSKSFENGKETIAKKLHNIPPKTNAGGKRVAESQTKSPIGNVEALSDLLDYK